MTPFTRENVRLWLEELRFGALIGLGLALVDGRLMRRRARAA